MEVLRKSLLVLKILRILKKKIQVQCILINFRYLRPKNFNMKITLKFNQGLEANNLVSCNQFITIP